MATFLKSANFTGYNGTHFYISLYYDVLSQSTISNQSVVRYYLYVGSRDGYSGYGAYANGYIGDTWVGGLSSIGANSFNYIGSRDLPYTHNDDGTLTVPYWASFNTSWGGVDNASLSGNLTLPKIDRYSIITNATNFTDEENPSITFTNVNLYDLRAKVIVGSTTLLSEDLADSTVVTYNFDLDNIRTQLRQLCTGQTLQVTLAICSLKDNEELYTSTQNVVMSMVNAEPTISYSVTEQNSKVKTLYPTGSKIILNGSKSKFTVTPTALKESTIVSVSVTHLNETQTLTESPYEFNAINVGNSSVFTIKATDSRGFQHTQKITRSSILYTPLSIASFTFERENETSSNLILNMSAVFDRTNFVGTSTQNPYNTLTIYWKLNNGSWHTISNSSITYDYENKRATITNLTLNNVLPYTESGTLSLRLVDRVLEVYDSTVVNKGIPTFDAGEFDFNVNGDLTISDTARSNTINVREELENKIKKYDLQTDTQEELTGRQIDGKDEYIKRYSSSLYQGTVTIPLGFTLSDVEITKIDGTAKSTSNNWFNLNIGDYDGSNTYANLCYLDNSNDSITISNPTGNFTKANIEICYTLND